MENIEYTYLTAEGPVDKKDIMMGKLVHFAVSEALCIEWNQRYRLVGDTNETSTVQEVIRMFAGHTIGVNAIVNREREYKEDGQHYRIRLTVRLNCEESNGRVKCSIDDSRGALAVIQE